MSFSENGGLFTLIAYSLPPDSYVVRVVDLDFHFKYLSEGEYIIIKQLFRYGESQDTLTVIGGFEIVR